MSGSQVLSRAAARIGLTLLVCFALIALGVSASGCATGPTSANAPSGSATTPSSQASSVGKTASATADPSVQTCGECGGKGKPKTIVGAAEVKDGVQVVSIAIQGGYYVPNTITVKAGMPVQVVFTGKAKGCVAQPKFSSLGKSGDVTATGASTVDLGTLQSGTYKFTCKMGANAGSIIAK